MIPEYDPPPADPCTACGATFRECNRRVMDLDVGECCGACREAHSANLAGLGLHPPVRSRQVALPHAYARRGLPVKEVLAYLPDGSAKVLLHGPLRFPVTVSRSEVRLSILPARMRVS